jgi:hypothetical protein
LIFSFRKTPRAISEALRKRSKVHDLQPESSFIPVSYSLGYS